MNDLIWILVCFGLIIISWIFLGMWTYRDASNRGLNVKLWTIIVLLGPNGIGLLLYFLVGRKQSFTKCSCCSNSIPCGSKFCNACGTVVSEIKIEELETSEKRSTKHLFIGFAASFLLAITCFIGGFFLNENIEIMGGSSLFLVEVNTKKKWNISYYKSTAKFSKTIEKQENPMTVYVDASCDEGQLYLKVTQEEKEELVDISNTAGFISIDLTSYENGDIKLEVLDEKCKGVGFEAYWE